MTTALVTGAGGFIGRHLCRRLEREGVALRCVSSRPDVRNAADVTLLEPQPQRLIAVLEGVSTVYFLAGIAHESLAGSAADALHRVNVAAPLAWLRAAQRAGVRRFVWLSSIKVLGDRSDRPLTPSDPYRPADPYAASKVEAEQRLLDETPGDTGLAVVRPPLVYGPAVGGNFARLLRLADSAWPLPTGAARAPRSLVAIDNLCDLLIRLGEEGAGKESSGIFHVSDGQDLPVASLVARLRCALGRSQRQIAVAPGALRFALGLVRRPGLYERLFEPLQLDIEDACRQLDWAPPRSADEALKETAQWFCRTR